MSNTQAKGDFDSPDGKAAPVLNNKPASQQPSGAKADGTLKHQNGTVNQNVNEGGKPVNGKPIPQDTATFEKVAEAYPWEKIGAFNEGKKFDRSFIANSHIIKTYIIETFHSDLYWNTSIVVGTCFFSWLVARLRFGIFGLVFVLLSTASVYRAEFRRFKRNVRDDIQRIASAEKLEESFESMEWLNQFLKKFWVIYMPALSDTVKTIANENLKDLAPGYGIDALSLDEFTLGSKSPTIDSIKSFTKKGRDVVEMDWAFSFTPDDESDMTKKEVERRVRPKVALGVTVGKAFVSKKLPILVENMSVSGRMKIIMTLSLNFPHIKLVSVSLLEPPVIDFSLKPVGGDTFGLDIMTFIPGLSTLINTLINSNAGPLLYAPNHLDVDVEEIMAGQISEAIGVIAVTVKGASELKESINPYLDIHAANESTKTIRTDVKADTKNPRWNETKYIIVDSLDQKLIFDLYNFDTSKKKGLLYGSHDFDLSDLLQQDASIDVKKPLTTSGKKKGVLNYDIRWFPVLNNKKVGAGSDDGSEIPDSEVGIFKFKLHQAKGLDNTVSLIGQLNPKAEVYINDELSHTFRTLKRSNEPSWEEGFELLVTQKSATTIKLVISEGGSLPGVIGTITESLDTLVFNVANGDDIFPLTPQGNVRLSAEWKPVSLSGVDAGVNYVSPIGVARVHIQRGHDLVNLETVGKVDPYVRVLLNNRKKYTTAFHPDTCDPNFNEVVFLPIASESEHVTFEVWDDQNLGKDRPLGSTSFSISKFIKKNADGSLLFYDGSQKVLTANLQRKNKKPKGQLTFTVSFLPAIPVYSNAELEELEQKKAVLKAKKIKEEEELKEWEELYKKSPNDYEWVEVEDDDEEMILGNKETLTLEQLLTYRSGTLAMYILGGTVKKADSYVQILFDNYAPPSFTTVRSSSRDVLPEVGDAFIRDLPNSIIVFRNTKKAVVKNVDQVIDEAQFKTIDLLQKGFKDGTTVKFGSSQVKIRFEFFPSAIKLPPAETVLDTGIAQIEFLDADNLAPADRNGKADPYVTLEAGDLEVFKSAIVKKTLSPVWNESTTIPIISRFRPNLDLKVYDWDRTGKNELIGSTTFDISGVPPSISEIVTFQLKPQGTVRARISFKPEYIRPKVGAAEFGLGFASLAGAPLKGVGAAADLATGVVGGGVGAAGGALAGGASIAGGAVGKSGSLFKSVLGGGKKSKKSMDQPRGSLDRYGNDAQSSKSGKSKTHLDESYNAPRSSTSSEKPKSKADPAVTELAPGVTSVAGDPSGAFKQKQHTRAASRFSNFTAAPGNEKKFTQGTVIVRSGSNIGNSAQLKISLAINGKLKEIHHTKTVKSSSGTVTWDEEFSFEAPTDAEMVFGGIVHHRLSKDQELGTAKVKLGEVVDNPRDVELSLGQGTIIVSFRYSPEPEHASAPPPADW